MISFAEYQHSVSEFEKVAEKLYESMSQKETLEKNKEIKMQTGMSVQEMRHYQQFVTNLETIFLPLASLSYVLGNGDIVHFL